MTAQEIAFLLAVEMPDANGCCLWRGKLQPNGYARWRGDYAHRQAFRLFLGEIPSGQEIGHTCDVRHCVNPEHLAPQTHQENMAQMRARGRGANQWTNATHCSRGHEFTTENIYMRATGKECAICTRERKKLQMRGRRHRAAERAA